MTIILGAGLAGLSASYQLNHDCEIFEKQGHSGGHVFSHQINGFTWDEGPHVSFTKHEYVKKLFEKSCEYLEYPVFPTNYYQGVWVDHPAQTNLYALPEPLRTQCLESFLSSRSETGGSKPANYKEWLDMAFGKRFSDEFPAVYTKKYWTTPAENLTTDWVGERVLYPKIEDVKNGYEKKPEKSLHYITRVRYPKSGGYFSYTSQLRSNSKIHFNKEVQHIRLKERSVTFKDGTLVKYDRLINTIPLPEFIALSDAPLEIKQHAENLVCSEVLLVNVVANHPPRVKNQWLYVYDADKYSTRISYTDLFASSNGVAGKCGIQVEVYFSKYHKQTESTELIAQKVVKELLEMKLIDDEGAVHEINTHRIKYANVIFDHNRRTSMDAILNFLVPYGLVREDDDLDAMTDWTQKIEKKTRLGNLIMAGRFGEWKYYWTDDCVMRGLQIGTSLSDK